jgi:hypothetical protein
MGRLRDRDSGKVVSLPLSYFIVDDRLADELASHQIAEIIGIARRKRLQMIATLDQVAAGYGSPHSLA